MSSTRATLRALRTTARAWCDSLLAAVFPSRCAACGGSLGEPSRGPLCGPCWLALPRHSGPICGCGFPLPRAVSAPCGRCRRGRTLFARGISVGPYEGSLRTLVQALKFRSKRRVAHRLAELLCADPRASAVLEPGVVLVPVPLHPRRLRERGFNQAELLAGAIARRTSLPLLRDGLVRRKETPAQTGLSAAARRRNVVGAFAARRRGRLQGRTVVLVDDVVTTGATARACASELMKAGAREVRMVAIARAI